MNILQRNPVCNLMKTSILRPKYGGVPYNKPPTLPSEQSKAPKGRMKMECRILDYFARGSAVNDLPFRPNPESEPAE
jgi:hypothetical protein